MWDAPVGAGAVVCANAVPTPIAEQRRIALTSDFIVNSFLNDEGATAIDRKMIFSCGEPYAAIRL
jgi:hypothetical protein